MIDQASDQDFSDSADDDQIDSANAFARAEGGSLVEPPGTAPAASAPSPGLPAGAAAPGSPAGRTPVQNLFVRLPCEGYGAQRFYHEVGARLAEAAIFRKERTVLVVNDESGAQEEMTANRFRTFVTEYMIPAKFTWNKDGVMIPREMTMTPQVAAGCLESDHFLRHLRPLARVNRERMPIIRGDGRLELLKPGYDAESRTYTLPSALQIDEGMTLVDARAIYNDLVAEFPFGDYKEDNDANRAAGTVGKSRSKAVHLANMLSLYGASLLDELNKRLHFVYVANAQRSGKTLLAQAAVVPIFGPAKTKSLPKDETELRKMLATAAFQNAPYFFLDDLEGMLKSTALNAFMTAATYSDRMFNSQEDRDARKQTVVIITGNNLGLSTDIANRTLRCQLYTDEFDAQARTIKREIDEEYLARPAVRRALLSACWAFVRAWNDAGRPKGRAQGGRVLKGFEAWCDIFGGIVLNAGYGDPIEAPPTDDFSGDTEGSDMDTLVRSLVYFMDNKLGTDGQPLRKHDFTFDDLVEAAVDQDCFTWMIQGTKRVTKKADGEELVKLELAPGSKSALGKMFSAKYGGRKFRLPDGRLAKFGHRGRNRHRRYEVEIYEAK